MPGRGDDDVITRPVPRRYVGIGQQGRDIAGRVCAPLVGQTFEIGLEIGDRARHDLEDLFRGKACKSRFVEFLVLAAEHLLGQEQHLGLVMFRHTQDLHDHVKRIGRRDQRDEIGLGPGSDETIRRARGQFADLRLDRTQVLGHEPFLRQAAQLRMFGRVERDQRRYQVGAFVALRLGDLAGKGFPLLVGEDRGARGVEEVGVVLRHPHRILVPGQQPERVEFALRALDPHYGCVAAQAVEGVEQRVPCGIGRGIDYRQGVGGAGDGAGRGAHALAPAPCS